MATLENIKEINLEESTFGTKTNWRDLNKWFREQEDYFRNHDFEDDQQRIKHIILRIDVRHWSNLANYFKNNQTEIKYYTLKQILLKKVRSVFDPSMAKYDDKVDGQIEKFKITNLNLDNMQVWLKRLRNICDGQGKTDYLTARLLGRVADDQLETQCTKLMKEIDDHIKLYHSRIKKSGNVIGKQKNKELNELSSIKSTILKFLD